MRESNEVHRTRDGFAVLVVVVCGPDQPSGFRLRRSAEGWESASTSTFSETHAILFDGNARVLPSYWRLIFYGLRYLKVLDSVPLF